MFLDMEALAEYVGVSATKDRAALTSDAELACQWVEDEAGPIAAGEVTERAWSTGFYCRLTAPANAIISIDGSPPPAVTIITPGGFEAFLSAGWHTVTYTTGHTTVPEWAIGAARARVKWLWAGRGGPKATGGGGIDWKARSEDLIEAHRRGARP